METTTLTSKGQLTLPKAVRDKLHLKTGDRLRVEVTKDGRVVLCELVWVLESGYGYSRDQLGEFMESLLHTRQFEFESRDAALAALRQYRQGKADFADALIGAANRSIGCKTTVTFDRKAAGLDTFTLL